MCLFLTAQKCPVKRQKRSYKHHQSKVFPLKRLLWKNLLSFTRNWCRNQWPPMMTIDDSLQRKKECLKSFRTAALWLQYMNMVDILHKHIWAERTGNWHLHLQSISEILPYMAALGHNNYTKDLHLYLQQMSNLQYDHPDVYQHFQDGLHVIRHSDRYWAGLSSDLVIEQVLMRSMKTNGDLIHKGEAWLSSSIWYVYASMCWGESSYTRTFWFVLELVCPKIQANKTRRQRRLVTGRILQHF